MKNIYKITKIVTITLLIFTAKLSFAQLGSSHYIDFDATESLDLNLNGWHKFNPIVVDLDNDGYKDILYANGDLILRKNLGGNSFAPPKILYIRSDDNVRIINNKISLGDFNKDGKIDIFVIAYYKNGNKNEGVSVFMNMGNLNFSILDLPRFENSCANCTVDERSYSPKTFTADINNDGYSEVIQTTTDFPHDIYIYKYNNGNVSTIKLFPNAGYFQSDFSAADIDGDDNADLITKEYYGNINYFKSLGDSGFRLPITKITDANLKIVSTFEIIIDDLDRDGKKDILSPVKSSLVIDGPTYFAWKKNLGNGIFLDFTTLIQLKPNEYIFEYKDIDFDGDKDLITIRKNTKLNYLSNVLDSIGYYKNINGAFTAFTLIKDKIFDLTQEVEPSFAYDDFDNDSINDLILFEQDSFKYYKSTINLTYSTRVPMGTYDRHKSIVIDIDNDSDNDIITIQIESKQYSNLSNYRLFISTYVNNPSGSFTKNAFFLPDSIEYFSDAAYLDYNNDGWQDIAIFDAYDFKTYICLNRGGVLSFYKSFNTKLTSTPEIADIDNNGQKDFISSLNSYYSRYSVVYINYADSINGILNYKMIDSSDYDENNKVLVDDFNNDGKPDVFVSNFKLYFNINGVDFVRKNIITPDESNNYYIKRMFSVDVNNDGYMDIVIIQSATSQPSDRLYVLLNNRDSSFSLKFNSTLTYNSYDFNMIDINNDSYIDLIFNMYNDVYVDGYRFYLNDGLGNFNYLSSVNNIFNQTPFNSNYITHPGFKLTKINNDNNLDIVSYCRIENQYILKWRETNFNDTSNRVIINVFYDVNANGRKDAGEAGLRNIPVNTPSETKFSDFNGNISLTNLFNTSTFTIAVPGNWLLTTNNVFSTVTLPSDTIQRVYFGLKPNVAITEVTPNIMSGYPRCSEVVPFWFDAINTANTYGKTKLVIEYDPKMTFQSSFIVPDSNLNNRLVYNVPDLAPTYNYGIPASFKLPDPTPQNIQDSFFVKATVYLLNNGVYSFHRNYSYKFKMRCSYDPNDKLVTPIGYDSIHHYVLNTDTLQYTIRFQNTGNDTAKNITIIDEITNSNNSTYINPTNIKILCSSHPVSKIYKIDNRLYFQFNNINLPDSGANFKLSQGFVSFKFVQGNTYNLDTLKYYNTADIIFDRNTPVKTNTVLNTFVKYISDYSLVFSGNRTIAPSTNYNATIKVTNTARTSNPGKLYFYLNNNVCKDSNLIYTLPDSIIVQPNQTITLNKNIPMPSYIKTDSIYALTCKFKSFNFIDIDSTNNKYCKLLNQAAFVDLNVSSSTITNDTLYIGDSLRVNSIIKNLGNTSSAYNYKIYLSKDTLINSGDLQIYNKTGSLTPDIPLSMLSSAIIPAYDTGFVYCIVSLDTISTESNKLNNKLWNKKALKNQIVTFITYYKSKNILIYPNPFVDNINIEFKNLRINDVKLFSIEGKQLSIDKISDKVYNCANCSNGLYLLQINYNDNIIETHLLKKGY